jgi:hypothetical protein
MQTFNCFGQNVDAVEHDRAMLMLILVAWGRQGLFLPRRDS